jgi:soluble lytic murein transglycosylase-like protein
MDLSQSINILKGVPDQALQRELTQPSGLVPGYLVLAEAQRRQLLRQAAQRQQTQPSGSVYDEVIRNMMSRQPPTGLPPAPAGMAPIPNAPPSGAMGTTPPGNFRIPGMADGGGVDDVDDTEDKDEPAPAAASPTGSYDSYIEQAARENHLDPDLLRAVISRESGGNRRAVSPKGAQGLMQLMPDTARGLGVTDPTDPQQNIMAGARYLRQQFDRFGNDRNLALAAYNAGPGNVDRFGGIPPFSETQKYVTAVNDRLRQIKGFMGGRPDLLPTGPIKVLDSAGNWTEQPAPVQATTSADRDTGLPPAPELTPPPAPPSPGPLDALMQGLPASQAPPLPSVTPAPAAVTNTAAVAPGAAPRDMVADLYTPEHINAMRAYARALMGDRPDDSAIRAEVAQLTQQAQKMAKPSIWRTLAALGSGMASSTSPFWGQALGAGAAAVVKDVDARQEQARQLQLAALGIDQRLDDRAQAYQEKLGGIAAQALNQAEARQAKIGRLSPSMIPYVIAAGADPNNPATWTRDAMNKAVELSTKIGAKATANTELADTLGLAGEDRRFFLANGKLRPVPANAVTLAISGAGGDPNDRKTWTPDVVDQAQRSLNQTYKSYEARQQIADDLGLEGPERKTLLEGGKPAPAIDPQVVKNRTDSVVKEPAAYFDLKPDMQSAVGTELINRGARVPVQKPNKTLQDQAASSTLALSHVGNVRNLVQDPFIQQYVLGPLEGRLMQGLETTGMDIPGATEAQNRKVQNFLTSVNYLFFREGRPLFGGRPPERLMEQLHKTSPGPTMSPARFNGAMDAVEQSARMAIQANHDWIYGGPAQPPQTPTGGGLMRPPQSVLDGLPVGDHTFRNGQRWRKNADGSTQYLGGGG